MTTRPALSFVQKSTLTVFGILVATGFLTSLAQTALAQTPNSSQPTDIFQDQDRNDPFSSRSSNQAGSMLDIVNRAILGPGRSAQEFNQDQKESLDDAANQFRTLQQQRLRNQQTEAPATTQPTGGVR